MPELASHFSGLGINATVLIDVLSQNKLQLSLEQPKFAKINQRLDARMNSMDGRDGQNWRELYLPEMTEVDSEIRSLLEQPIVFELVRGEIRLAKISREEPEWSVNFKKALALLFQTKVDSSSWQPEGNHVRFLKKKSVRSEKRALKKSALKKRALKKACAQKIKTFFMILFLKCLGSLGPSGVGNSALDNFFFTDFFLCAIRQLLEDQGRVH